MARLLVLLASLCVLTWHVAQAQIAMSTYVNVADVVNVFPSCCDTCDGSVVMNVLGDNNRMLPFTYTYCESIPPKFSLSVGVGCQKAIYFKTDLCMASSGALAMGALGSVSVNTNSLRVAVSAIPSSLPPPLRKKRQIAAEIAAFLAPQFLPLDVSKATFASQFYWDCKQALLYKCADYYVFDLVTGRCVPGGQLVPKIDTKPLLPCEWPTQSLPGSAFVCESLLYKSMYGVCRNCTKPYIQNALFAGSNKRSPVQYTYCADDGRFSIDLVVDGKPHTYFTPKCEPGKMVFAIDPTRSTLAAKMYWDCNFGLMECPGENDLFDPETNTCKCLVGTSVSSLPTGLESCKKTCGGYSSPYPVSYAPPAPYGQVNYGK